MNSFPQPNNAGTKILQLLTKCTSPAHLHQIQAQIILQNLHPNPTITSQFITISQSLNLLNSSLLLFHQIPKPHVFICNSLIRAFSHSHSPQISISIYTHMHKTSISPNNYTFPFLLKSLSDLKNLKLGQCVHTHVAKLGHLTDIYVQNSLLNLYSSCRDMRRCQQLFDEMPERDVVSWTTVIEGYKRSGKVDDALLTFEKMQFSGVVPNRVTMVNALSACACSGAIEMGVWIHEFIKRNEWDLDVVLGSSLIEMYGKCGRIEVGLSVFESMDDKNIVTWNSLIKGLALAKSGEEALRWFYRMEEEGIGPDEITLVEVLSACSHSGLVQEGRKIFRSILDGRYGFAPNVKHYGCIIDLLARSGYLNEAYDYMVRMPFEANKLMWGSLLGGCRTHGNLELSVFSAIKLVELEPENGSYYAILSNLYAEMGRWDDVDKVRSLMKQRGLEKDLGSSSIEIEERTQQI